MTDKLPISSLTAFAVAQAQMGSAFKNAENPFLKTKYADLTAIQNAVYPAFHANGFAIMQSPGKDEFGPFVETIFAHVSGDKYSGKVYLEYKANDMQSLGGAITYARRYGLASISGVPIEDDDGNAATGRYSSASSYMSQPSPSSRGIKFLKFLEGDMVTEERLRTVEDEAKEVIRGIKLVNKGLAEKVELAFEAKKTELGIM